MVAVAAPVSETERAPPRRQQVPRQQRVVVRRPRLELHRQLRPERRLQHLEQPAGELVADAVVAADSASRPTTIPSRLRRIPDASA